MKHAVNAGKIQFQILITLEESHANLSQNFPVYALRQYFPPDFEWIQSMKA